MNWLEVQIEPRTELTKITYIEEVEAVTYTFGQYVPAQKKGGEARGRKQILLEYIKGGVGRRGGERVCPGTGRGRTL